jgi:hypothetical protein
MAYSLIGERFHEIAGSLMLVLFVVHHRLNRTWTRNLFRGRYTARRVFQTAVNLLLMIFMIMQPVCGILMSKHLYDFLPTAGLADIVRSIHLPLANWGFILMSLHAGTHLGSMLPKKARNTWVICLAAISIYGIFAFFKRGIPDYMFLKQAFVFFDYGEPLGFFLFDYIAVIILFVMAGYLLTRSN